MDCAKRLSAWPKPARRGAGLIPSSRQSADTEVSRWAIAAWASRTWAFDSANVPAAVAAARPRGREPGPGAFADQLPLELGQRREDAEHEAPGGGGGVDPPRWCTTPLRAESLP